MRKTAASVGTPANRTTVRGKPSIFLSALTSAGLRLDAVGAGEAQAAEKLLPLVYEELRRLAEAQMAGQAPGQTLQPTALVQEAWLRLVGANGQGWNGRLPANARRFWKDTERLVRALQ